MWPPLSLLQKMSDEGDGLNGFTQSLINQQNKGNKLTQSNSAKY